MCTRLLERETVHLNGRVHVAKHTGSVCMLAMFSVYRLLPMQAFVSYGVCMYTESILVDKDS